MTDEQREKQRFVIVYTQSYANGTRLYRVEFYSMTGTDRNLEHDFSGSHTTDEANLGSVIQLWLVHAAHP